MTREQKAAENRRKFPYTAELLDRLTAKFGPGFRVRAQIVAEPLPPEAQALVARWQYSPPDEHGSNDAGQPAP